MPLLSKPKLSTIRDICDYGKVRWSIHLSFLTKFFLFSLVESICKSCESQIKMNYAMSQGHTRNASHIQKVIF